MVDVGKREDQYLEKIKLLIDFLDMRDLLNDFHLYEFLKKAENG